MNKRGQNNFFRNNKGQFFLIAAVIIIVVVVSLVTVSNYTQKKDDIKLYDLGEELGIESQQVLDYGTYNSLNETSMKDLMENFIKSYVDYVGEGKNLYFVFGNQQKVYVIGYQELVEETVCVTLNPTTPVCGNGEVETGEECDDGDEYYWDGCSKCELRSSYYCREDDKKSKWEICDGDELGGETCKSLGFESGELLCSDCEFNTENCVRKEDSECVPLQVTGETQEFPATNGDITKVVIRVENIDYEFALKYGENFYFVIWQEISGEKHVITSEEGE